MGLFDSLKKAFGGGKEETVEEQKYDTGLEKKAAVRLATS